MIVRYTTRAIADLDGIEAYISLHNPTAAVAVGARKPPEPGEL